MTAAPSLDAVADALEVLAAHVRAQASANPARQSAATDWISQRDSVLSRRRHINACRRRVAEGLEGASIVGRRYLLTPAAIDAELGRLTAARATAKPAKDELADLRRRFTGAERKAS